MVMKISYFILTFVFIMVVGLVACGDNSGKSQSNEGNADSTTVVDESLKADEELGKSQADSTKNGEVSDHSKGVEYTSKYICPNHCKGSGSDKEGECTNPDCGMELMENPNYKEK